MRKDYDDIIQAKEDLSKEVETLQEKQKTLEETIYRENRGKKSLEELATKKTSLIERMINRATEQVFQCFVEVSKGEVC
jgi:predicted  nucleic acid-binding Zn-ribbon protein